MGIFNHFSRGFFYTIGKIIAFAFIGLVLATLFRLVDSSVIYTILGQQ